MDIPLDKVFDRDFYQFTDMWANVKICTLGLLFPTLLTCTAAFLGPDVRSSATPKKHSFAQLNYITAGMRKRQEDPKGYCLLTSDEGQKIFNSIRYQRDQR